MSPVQSWSVRRRKLDLGRPLVMGILNVTPDSFADGGLYLDPGAAEAAAIEMAARGADLIDVGGESTRPGSDTISADEEIARVR
ncbi:MAG TPA: dihydropteroate synthase, partial [Gemmatimonadaceae bacterium]|nr:dihydropteroate synthase [Gemmatimonadaceae bacterium]